MNSPYLVLHRKGFTCVHLLPSNTVPKRHFQTHSTKAEWTILCGTFHHYQNSVHVFTWYSVLWCPDFPHPKVRLPSSLLLNFCFDSFILCFFYRDTQEKEKTVLYEYLIKLRTTKEWEELPLPTKSYRLF